MTVLDRDPTQAEPVPPVQSSAEPTRNQIEFFTETVKPRLNWHGHLGWMAAKHSNIVLGEE